MMGWRKTWLVPPEFPGEATKTRRAYLLNVILPMLVLGVGMILLGSLLSDNVAPIVLWLDLAAILGYVGLWFAMRAGKVQFASVGLVVLALASITLSVTHLGTLRTPTTAMYLVLVIGASLLFDSIGILVTVIASAVLVFVLFVAEGAGWLPPPDFSVSVTQAITYTVLIALTGILSYWGLQFIRQALARADQELAERRLAETALRESEQNFGAFFNSIDDLLFVLDERGDILWSNATVTRRLQYSAQELRGLSVLTVHPPERRAEAAQIVADMLGGKASFCPVPVQAKDGTLIPVETRIVQGTWSGRPAIFGVTKDLSALKASEEKFAKAFNASPALMAISDAETGIYLEVNEAFLRTLEFTRADVIGRSSRELHVFADPVQREQALQLIQTQGFLREYQVSVRARSGQILHGVFSAEYIQLQDRRLLLTVMSDVSEIKREEARIKLRLLLDTQANQLSEQELVQLGLEEAVRLTGSAIGYCHFINPDAKTIQLVTWSQATLEKFCTAVYDSHYPLDVAGVWADCARTGEPVIHNDYQHLPERRGYPAGHSEIMRHLSVPVFEDRRICVILGVGNKPALYSEADVRLVQLIGDDVWSVVRRKRAEEKLRASEERYRTLVDNLPMPVFTKDLAGRYTSCNPENLKYWDTNPIGRTDAETLPSDIASVLQDADKRVIASNQALDVEEQWHAPFGVRTMLARKVPLRDADGQVTGILGVSIDITDRKHLEQELQTERDFVVQVMNTMGQGLTITNHDGQFEFVNPAYAHLMGYEPAELMGKGPRDVTVPVDRAVLEEAFEARKQGKITMYESQLIHRDGSNVPVLITGVPVVNARFTGSIAVITDLTDRKRIEEQLRASEELYRQMFVDHSAIMLLVDPASGQIIDANSAAAEFYGYSLEQLRQMNIAHLNIMPAAQVAQARLAAAARSQNYFIFHHRLSSGEIRDVEIYSVPIQTRQRTVLYSIIHDVTARLQAEAQLRYLSTHDSLTGLYNRAFFESESARLEGSREFPLSIVIADVDNMKTTNDTLGHLMGDMLLKEAARLFRTVFRTSDIVARIGGDEFAILLPGTDTVVADQIIARIRNELNKFAPPPAAPKLELSMGVATAERGDVLEAFRQADARMYADKRTHH